MELANLLPLSYDREIKDLTFIILFYLMPDNFTCQGESTGAQWVNAHTFIYLFI